MKQDDCQLCERSEPVKVRYVRAEDADGNLIALRVTETGRQTLDKLMEKYQSFLNLNPTPD